MPAGEPDTEVLLARAGAGDTAARQRLLEQYRGRLRRLVAVRLDARLAARADASDVVQEALADAARKLDGYLRDRPLPFYPWLRQLAWERLVKVRRLHTADRRSVDREEPPDLPDASATELAQRLAGSVTGPIQRLVREELWARVRSALDRLSAADRELLILRHAEQLSTREAAAVLGVTEAALKSRHLRALERLREALGGNPLEESS
jgi:RNA polymerase sigma-70 factor (ECF subfamily)